jgi:hypothetical protein
VHNLQRLSEAAKASKPKHHHSNAQGTHHSVVEEEEDPSAEATSEPGSTNVGLSSRAGLGRSNESLPLLLGAAEGPAGASSAAFGTAHTT